MSLSKWSSLNKFKYKIRQIKARRAAKAQSQFLRQSPKQYKSGLKINQRILSQIYKATDESNK